MRDLDIRLALRKEMWLLHNGDLNTRVVEELCLCQGIARVDMAVVNGSLHGYEIKSERDTLSRLAGQRDAYNTCFEFVTIIVSASHLEKVIEAVPSWWGIRIAVACNGEVQLREERTARKNELELSTLALAQLLWRTEALAILERHNLAGGMRSKPRAAIWNRLASSLTASILAAEVRSTLKLRDGWKPASRQM